MSTTLKPIPAPSTRQPKFAHTAGDWRTNQTANEPPACIWTADNKTPIVSAIFPKYFPCVSLEERTANLNLCAAAPKLLKSLLALHDWMRIHTSPNGPNSTLAILTDSHNAIIAATKKTPDQLSDWNDTPDDTPASQPADLPAAWTAGIDVCDCSSSD
ncbi:MAG: hypothetical protein NT069_15745 [Planctomycetota bacterium]|nr:hypothetical protein [Planctomycetota bacterium]